MGAFLVLAAIIILFGSYLLQFQCLAMLTAEGQIFGASSTGRRYKLAVVEHRHFEVATKFCIKFVPVDFDICLTLVNNRKSCQPFNRMH